MHCLAKIIQTVLPRAILLAALLRPATFASAASPDANRWHLPDWSMRRALNVEPEHSGPPSSVAWLRCELPAGVRPDGGDLRVAGPDGAERPMRLMLFDSEVYAAVAFELGAEPRQYWLYMGNKNAPPIPEWRPNAGLWLETRQRPDNFDPGGDLLSIPERSAQSFGGAFVAQVWHGYNAYGRPDNYLSRYDGWLQIERAGRYEFCTISDDGSALFVDGRRVCAYGGGRLRESILPNQTGIVDLDAGAHHFQYFQGEFGGDQMAIAGWKTPGRSEFSIIPASAFVNVRRADAGPLEMRDGGLAPDFRAQQLDWMNEAGQQFLQYRFIDISQAGPRGAASRLWTFDDGTSATGQIAEKIFFWGGSHQVKLKITDERGRSAEAARRIRLFPIDKPETTTELAVVETLIGKLLRGLPAGLDRRGVQATAALFEANDYRLRAADAYRTLIAQMWKEKRAVDAEALGKLLALAEREETIVAGTAKYGADLIGRLPDDAPDRPYLLMALARIQWRRLNQPAEAALTAKRVLARLPAGEGRQALERQALIALGECQRRTGDCEGARDSLTRAEALPAPGPKKDTDRSSFALTVESYLRSKEYGEAQATLDKWEELYPTERIAGFCSVLRARVAAADGHNAEAVAELEVFMRCDPRGVFRQMGLEDLGGYYAQEGRFDDARRVLEQGLREFPDKDAQARFGQKLKSLAPPG